MIIGIDTSNYTTSVSAVSEGSIRYDLRRILTVKDGGRGLRQSEAFYQHLENLPELFAERRLPYAAIFSVCACMQRQ